MEPCTKFNAIVINRHSGKAETVYAGSVPTRALTNGKPDAEWRKTRRKQIISELTGMYNCPGYRIVFEAITNE